MKYNLEESLKECMKNNAKMPEQLTPTVLQNLKEENSMSKKETFRRKASKRTAVAAFTLIIGAGSISLAAIHGLNKDVARILHLEENTETQEKLVSDGYATTPITDQNGSAVKTTDQDITVSAIQTLGDQKEMSVYLEVQFGEQYDLHIEKMQDSYYSDVSMEIEFYNKKQEPIGFASGIMNVNPKKHSIIYCYNLSENFSESDLTIKILKFFNADGHLECPSVDDTVLAEGSWILQWKPDIGAEKITCNLNKTVPITNNLSLEFVKVEINPYAATIYVKDTKDFKHLKTSFDSADCFFMGRKQINVDQISPYDKVEINGISCIPIHHLFETPLEDCSKITGFRFGGQVIILKQ